MGVGGTNINEVAAKKPFIQKYGFHLLLIPPVLFLVGFLFIPFIQVIINSFFDPEFTLIHYIRFFKEPAYYQVLWNTIKISMIITFVTLILGYPVAYMLVLVPDRLRNILFIFILLPFWTSFLVRTYAWIVILQKEGIVNQLLMDMNIIGEPLMLVHNTTGVVIGMSHVLLPYMILPLYSVIKGIDFNLVKAAQNLGASPTKSFLKVFLPLSVPGIAAGSILVFVISIGYYVIPALLGGAKDTMISQLIAQQISGQLNFGFGSAIAVVLLVVIFIILYFFNKFVGIKRISFGS